MKQLSHDDLLQDAQKLWHEGYDNEYIHGQLSEQGANEDSIQNVLKKVNVIRKSEKRRRGVKLMIGGLATIAVAFLFTLISFQDGSPIAYVLYGLMTAGVMTFAKGAVDMI
jgi:hypothetical protein